MSKCRYCGQELNWLYPESDLPIVMQFGHTSLEDARACPVPAGVWPHPSDEDRCEWCGGPMGLIGWSGCCCSEECADRYEAHQPNDAEGAANE